MDNDWIDEYHEGVRYGLKGKVIIKEFSPYQEIAVIESERYGRGLLLDSCWMTAEKQEKHYHECLAQPALCGAKNLDKILIIGGGDGGTAKECLKHKEVGYIDLVEIDSKVIEICQEYIPTIGGNAWNDPRLNIAIEDGIKFVEQAQQDSYDIILVDGSDAKGPAEGLFNRDFFENCQRILKPNGIFATQSESPEAFLKVHIEIINLINEIFNYSDPLYGWVPMYPSGWWSWTFAAIDKPRYLNPIKRRVDCIEQNCQIWSPRWQKGAFQAMPAFIERGLKK